ncbi:FAD-dependent oxidoreductase [Paraburkholderia sp. CNPSo 3274]|nr:FAD-dependent oxidoreductase [Paraburkholderia sp. CNPSo 3274]MCP3705624.1 FAD-dependent oxidoreductase [Paraburkholderia sp. CNPSo 3274]
MDGENVIANIDQTDWAALKGRLIEAGCQVLMMPAVGGKIAHWNGALDPRPKMLVRCSTVAQVSSVMRAASGFDAPLAVYNGGQDWTGRSMRDGSLLLDLCDLRTIEIDTGRSEATIGAGVTSAQLNRAAGERGLAAVIGNDGAVSMAGLTLGGGYGPDSPRLRPQCVEAVPDQNPLRLERRPPCHSAPSFFTGRVMPMMTSFQEQSDGKPLVQR